MKNWIIVFALFLMFKADGTLKGVYEDDEKPDMGPGVIVKTVLTVKGQAATLKELFIQVANATSPKRINGVLKQTRPKPVIQQVEESVEVTIEE